MILDHKEQVTKALKNSKLSQAEISRKTGVNKSYVSKIKNGTYHNEYKTKGEIKTSYIPDDVFLKLAGVLGVHFSENEAKNISKSNEDTFDKWHWETNAYFSITARCKDAQIRKRRVIIQGQTGIGKTYSLQKYAKNPHVIYAKATASMSANDFVTEILEAFGLTNFKGNLRKKVKAIQEFISLNTEINYLLIVDELENVRKNIFKTVKEVADFCENKCGVVLCGIDLDDQLYAKSQKNQTPYMQLHRRFRGNRLILHSITKGLEDTPEILAEQDEIKMILDGFGISNPMIIRWFKAKINDFDTLNLYLNDVVTAFDTKGMNIEMLSVSILNQFFQTDY